MALLLHHRTIVVVALVSLTFTTTTEKQQEPSPPSLPPESVVPESPHEPSPLPHNNCLPCEPGSYASKNCTILRNTTQVWCATGYCLPDGTGELNCTLCHEGTHQNDTAQNNCIPCQPGYYAKTPGSINCTICPAGSFCPSTHTIRPVKCQEGHYCPMNGMSISFSCPGGYKCIGLGTIEPVLCDPGFFCNSGSTLQQQCPSNTYCKTGGCTQCNPCFSPFLESGMEATECYVSSVLYIVVVLGVFVLGLLILFIYTIIQKKKEIDEDPTGGAEITNLIPHPGPKYTGL